MNINSLINSVSQSTPAMAKNETNQGPLDNKAEQKKAQEEKETLIEKAYRSMLLNRMGVDTERLEEIEKKIEELESQDDLSKDDKDKLESLMSARDQLFEEAMRRQAEGGNDGKQPISPGDIQKIITEDFNPREISPNDMSKLANQLFEAGAISAQQRNRMDFHTAKTDQQNTLMSEPEQIDPDEPMNFVKHWQDRVKANEHFDASPQEKALAQGVLDVLRQV
ncbi:hypothetical protein U0358_12975 [Idiomarina sp. PL1-037]|uniref:hypothetical protein n=1 Tax=Idiomarina sp. PL1-037 TaxID=3095365 RepID=UPI002ACBF4B1|nr:hypothetical protein [Idiomarina sp. PL1-037]WQC52933.1 hypothetical protein U0358_12975 [Idiomarina sp. PL1-037]